MSENQNVLLHWGQYSSYFPDYDDEASINLKSILSKEFASYNMSAFQVQLSQHFILLIGPIS